MTTNATKPSIAFWIISIIGFLWNAMGVDAYLNQSYKTDRFKSMYSEEQLEIMYNLPSWVTAAFAIAVFTSIIGCVLLLIRKKAAKTFFLVGLLAVIVQSIYNIFMNPGKDIYGAMDYSMLIMIPLFSVFLFWYAKKSADDGILK
ncbi:MAG: hypothetical protein AB8B78_00440 [Polaribacter sp.]